MINPPSPPGSIALWNLALSKIRADEPRYRQVLSAEEQQRAQNYCRPLDAAAFILGRGILRTLLGRILETAPDKLRFGQNPNGKPFLENGRLHFNLSHSRDRLLIAIAEDRPIGIDVEFRRETERIEPIAERWFTAEEQSHLKNSADPRSCFFDIWTLKEAFVKARGDGVYNGFPCFTVPLGLPTEGPLPSRCGHWFFQRLDVHPDYAAALVSTLPSARVYLQPPP